MRTAQREMRCAKTELYVSQCAHCRHIESPSPIGEGEVGVRIRAQYNSDCVSCLGPIHPGEMIARLLDGGGWICESCLP